ncbi:MAG TPA: hypothetical protein VFC63_13915 [Blastocatellia bacterium]|nr:hypothetical protein [Blastocatellia bacterium]
MEELVVADELSSAQSARSVGIEDQVHNKILIDKIVQALAELTPQLIRSEQRSQALKFLEDILVAYI